MFHDIITQICETRRPFVFQRMCLCLMTVALRTNHERYIQCSGKVRDNKFLAKTSDDRFDAIFIVSCFVYCLCFVMFYYILCFTYCVLRIVVVYVHVAMHHLHGYAVHIVYCYLGKHGVCKARASTIDNACYDYISGAAAIAFSDMLPHSFCCDMLIVCVFNIPCSIAMALFIVGDRHVERCWLRRRVMSAV